jgi:hypothetical protein
MPNQALEWMQRTSAALKRQALWRTTQLNVNQAAARLD